MQPLVSVVIPCCNAEATLARAISSVRAQDYKATELVLVDDCSTDSTLQLLQLEQGSGARVATLSSRTGASNARNVGVALATGSLIAFLDADDEWAPTKLSRQVALIQDRPQMSFVSCATAAYLADKTYVSDLYAGFPPATGFAAWKTLLAYNFVATPSVLVRREIFQCLGGFDKSLAIGEDQDLWIRLSLRGEVGYVNAHLVIVHQQPNSLSHTSAGRWMAWKSCIENHVLAQSHRLSRKERRAILGCRYTQLAKTVYLIQPLAGFCLLAKAICFGYRPANNLHFLFMASPHVRTLKELLFGGGMHMPQHTSPLRGEKHRLS